MDTVSESKSIESTSATAANNTSHSSASDQSDSESLSGSSSSSSTSQSTTSLSRSASELSLASTLNQEDDFYCQSCGAICCKKVQQSASVGGNRKQSIPLTTKPILIKKQVEVGGDTKKREAKSKGNNKNAKKVCLLLDWSRNMASSKRKSKKSHHHLSKKHGRKRRHEHGWKKAAELLLGRDIKRPRNYPDSGGLDNVPLRSSKIQESSSQQWVQQFFRPIVVPEKVLHKIDVQTILPMSIGY